MLSGLTHGVIVVSHTTGYERERLDRIGVHLLNMTPSLGVLRIGPGLKTKNVRLCFSTTVIRRDKMLAASDNMPLLTEL